MWFALQVAQALCGEDLIIKGVSVHISNAEPKHNNSRQMTDGGQSGAGGLSQGCGSNRRGVNVASLGLNPAMVAAALQRSWGVMGMLANQQGQTRAGSPRDQSYSSASASYSGAGPAGGGGWAAGANSASGGGFSSGFGNPGEPSESSDWGV